MALYCCHLRRLTIFAILLSCGSRTHAEALAEWSLLAGQIGFQVSDAGLRNAGLTATYAGGATITGENQGLIFSEGDLLLNGNSGTFHASGHRSGNSLSAEIMLTRSPATAGNQSVGKISLAFQDAIVLPNGVPQSTCGVSDAPALNTILTEARITVQLQVSGNNNLPSALFNGFTIGGEVGPFGHSTSSLRDGNAVQRNELYQQVVSFSGQLLQLPHSLTLTADARNNSSGQQLISASASSTLSIELLGGDPKAKLKSQLTREDILSGSVRWERVKMPENDHVIGRFTPKYGLTLAEAAELLNYDRFNWINLVRNDEAALTSPLLLRISGNTMAPPTSRRPDGTVAPYVDSPPGGYLYQGAVPGQPVRDHFPTYWDEQFAFPNGAFVRRVCGSLIPIEDNESLIDVFTNDRPDSVEILRVTPAGLEPFVTIDPHSLVFVDAAGCLGCDVSFTTSLSGVREESGGTRQDDALFFQDTFRRWDVSGGTTTFRDSLSFQGAGSIVLSEAIDPQLLSNDEFRGMEQAGIGVVRSNVPEVQCTCLISLAALFVRRRTKVE